MLEELTKRRIFKTLAIYVAVAWAIAQILVEIVDRLGAPQWVGSVVIIVFIAGFPLATIFAWMYDIDGGKVHRVATLKKGLMAWVLVAATTASAGAAIIFYIQSGDPGSATPIATKEDTAEIAVALFPFDDLSVSDENIFLGRTISKQILDRLVRVGSLKTKSLEYVEAMLERGLDVVQISEKLNASHILSGSFRTEGDVISLNVQLIDARNGDITWSDELQGDMSDLLRMQQLVTDNVAVAVGSAADDALVEVFRSVNPEAYRLYAEASQQFIRLDYERATELLSRATMIDPDFAEALALLGQVFINRGWIAGDMDGPFILAGERYARRALAVEPELTMAYSALALAKAIQHRWQESMEMLNEMFARSTNSQIDRLAAPTVVNFGYIDWAIEISERLAAENPYGVGYQYLSVYYSSDRQFDRALQAADLAISYGTAITGFRLGAIHARRGDIQKATEMLRMAAVFFNFDPDLAPDFVAALVSGEISQDLDDALTDAARRDESFDAQLIFWYVYLGYPADSVFELADRLVDTGRLNHLSFFEYPGEKYRDDPRFLQLMERIGLVKYWRTVELPKFCDLNDGELICH